jgi:ceramide glucosyltransferase
MDWLLAALAAGSTAYCVLVIVAARQYSRSARRSLPAAAPGVSILKPLSGADEGLEQNLRSFFEQDYPGAFEILFAVRDHSDPAAAAVERLRVLYPDVPSRLLIAGEPPFANAKVWSLLRMTEEARHELLAMSDSDIRVTPSFLSSVAAEFEADPNLAVTTCPYRAVPGGTLWSRLEAIMMNTDFLSGILVARMIEGMRFAVGPTIVARKEAIVKIGGWECLRDYLAEDFMLGRLAAASGLGVGLSGYVIEHRIGGQRFSANARHRLRWCRSTRRSRPAGYAGQLFTYPVPLALLLWVANPAWWPLCVIAILLRSAAAYRVACGILNDSLTARRWYLLPAADLASFVCWIGGFFGNRIAWRGRTYFLHADGRFERIA